MLVRETGRIKAIMVPAAKDKATSSEGWKLDLNPGWKVVSGAREGDQTVAKQ